MKIDKLMESIIKDYCRHFNVEEDKIIDAALIHFIALTMHHPNPKKILDEVKQAGLDAMRDHEKRNN